MGGTDGALEACLGGTDGALEACLGGIVGALEADLGGTDEALEADLGGRVVTQTAGFIVADGFTVVIEALSIVEPFSK